MRDLRLPIVLLRDISARAHGGMPCDPAIVTSGTSHGAAREAMLTMPTGDWIQARPATVGPEMTMNTEHIDRRAVPSWVILLVAVLALVVAAAALTAFIVRPTMPWSGSMMSGAQPGTVADRGMMGRPDAGTNGAQPGEAGFVAGTVAVPRVVRIAAGPGYTFTPSSVAVARGETITFVVTAMGPAVHEFMVGPADAVAADTPGTPEVADIAMMQSKSLTYTFDGSGPYAYACHADGHYEAGMHGTITLVG
jgi:uncharacterized cupredoxin-like copper-binding protein